jgi:hypothetical protein
LKITEKRKPFGNPWLILWQSLGSPLAILGRYFGNPYRKELSKQELQGLPKLFNLSQTGSPLAFLGRYFGITQATLWQSLP